MNRWLWALAGAAAGLLHACTSVECGPGTVDENGLCVPAPLAACEEGLQLVDGACRPCPGGTCLSASACGPGTELVDGRCHIVDVLRTVTVPEAPEPNEDAEDARLFELPPEGHEAVVLGGTVSRLESGADFDTFRFEASAFDRIRIEAIAVGAPGVAVRLQPMDGPQALHRYVVDVEARQASRDIVLPMGGSWLLTVSETTNFAEVPGGGAPRGGDSFTYAVRVSRGAAVIPEPFEPGATGTYRSGGVFRVPGAQAVQVLDLLLEEPDGLFNGARSLWATDPAGRLVLAVSDTPGSNGRITRMEAPRVALPPEGVILGVDHVLHLPGPDAFTLSTTPLPVVEVLPPFPWEHQGRLTPNGPGIHAIEITGSAILSADIGRTGWDLSPVVEIRNPRFELVASGTFDEVRALVSERDLGRWFVVVRDRYPYASDDALDYELVIDGVDVTSLGAVGPDKPISAPLQSTPRGLGIFVAEETMLVRVAAVPTGAFDVELELFDGALDRLASGRSPETGFAAILTGIEVDAGDAVLVSCESSTSGQVTINVEGGVPVHLDEVEPNDDEAEAMEVSVPEASQLGIAGEISNRNDEDWFRFEAPAGRRLKVECRPGRKTGAAPDLYLDIYDALGNLLGSDDDAGERLLPLVLTDPLPGGTVYVRLRYSPLASGSPTNGEYWLSFELL